MRVTGRRGRVAIAVVAVLGIAACDGGEPATSTTEKSTDVVDTGRVAVTELVTGDCLVDIVVGRQERIEVDSAATADCAGRHDLEVFTTFDLTPEMVGGDDGAYPGRGRVIAAAEEGCNRALAATGIDTDLLGAYAFWPSVTSWGAGDRAVACAIYLQSGRQFDGRQVQLQSEPTDG